MSPPPLLSPSLRWWPLGLMLLLGACSRDEGPARLAEAQRKYAELVERRIPPRDAAWDPVFAQLESIPPDSKAHSEAQQRLQLLRKREAKRQRQETFKIYE